MKKLIAMLLVLSLLSSVLIACDNGTPTQTSDAESSGATTAPETGPESTPADVDAPTDPTAESSTAPTEPSGAEQPEDPSGNVDEPQWDVTLLYGSWSSALVEGNALVTGYLVFREDGTGYTCGCEYYNVYLDAEYYNAYLDSYVDANPDEDGWCVLPMGYPADYFTYSLEGSTLHITYTECDYEDYEDYTVSIPVQELSQDRLMLDNRYGVYVPADSYSSLRELCQAVGVAYPVIPLPEISPEDPG